MQATASNMAGGAQTKSAMKNTTGKNGVRPSSSRRKVVISDNPNRSSTVKSMNLTANAPNNTGQEGNLQSTGKSQASEGANATATSGGKNLLTKRQSKPAYLQSLNESEKQANFKIIDSMNKKISYLKNPRHKVNKAPILMTTVSFHMLYSLSLFHCN